MIDILLSNMKKIRLPATDLWQTTTTPSIYTSRPQRKKKKNLTFWDWPLLLPQGRCPSSVQSAQPAPQCSPPNGSGTGGLGTEVKDVDIRAVAKLSVWLTAWPYDQSGSQWASLQCPVVICPSAESVLFNHAAEENVIFSPETVHGNPNY